jgi:UDP-N-acetylglucosamine diphosphorylase / glucose-1-phosphate thymidylyltransferase / UDP-N-acetylgalactosamine diphosphorylase / glucosamine-1-phosphate N-acetyltransferase / galactosamine-1-phosphate N-acetyltransferase
MNNSTTLKEEEIFYLLYFSSCMKAVERFNLEFTLLKLGYPSVMFHSAYFFDVSQFSHAILFQGNPLPWLVLLSLQDYLKSQSLGKHLGDISPLCYLIDPELISIGEGSVVEPGAYIRGPCIIGKHCTIRHGAYIRGNVLIGDHCVIGHDSELKQAILFDHVHAAHFAYIGDSILGHGVNLGAQTTCANVRLDRSTIQLHLNGQMISTQMQKLGAIIGDHTQLGCHTVTNPGTLVGQNVHCYPCLNIEGFIPSHSKVKPSTKPVVISDRSEQVQWVCF